MEIVDAYIAELAAPTTKTPLLLWIADHGRWYLTPNDITDICSSNLHKPAGQSAEEAEQPMQISDALSGTTISWLNAQRYGRRFSMLSNYTTSLISLMRERISPRVTTLKLLLRIAAMQNSESLSSMAMQPTLLFH